MIKTRDKVLNLLKEMQGEYISGQELADRLFVTRAAVWKAIKTLQEQGFSIDAITNKGYRLKYEPDLIEVAKIQEELEERGIAAQVFYYEEVESTNDVALEKARECNKTVLVLAEAQTKGRGRRGREFFSPKNTGLYMSIAFPTNKSIEEFKNLTAMAASATALAIDEVVFEGKDTTKIKWVNDIFLEGRKVAGILTELYGTLEEEYKFIVIGIGINIYTPEEDFPKEIKGIAGTVFSKGQRKEGDIRNQICIAVVKNLFSFMEKRKVVKQRCLSTYQKKSFLIGNYVKINNFTGNHEYAYVTGISDEYELLVTYEDQSRGKLITGEVSVVKY